MRIGLDFDNTLARYDHVFVTEAKFQKLVTSKWHGNKKQLGTTNIPPELINWVEENSNICEKICKNIDECNGEK